MHGSTMLRSARVVHTRLAVAGTMHVQDVLAEKKMISNNHRHST